ncbi:EAL domain-containing protein [Pseudoduganella sp. UC29_106]|uniref:bifunctional diguanylate cyclase/phosphodiesterase n=1 Tax=Pseudoduganella sp. UC29_106 TaxID=3374553 RepID=UPI0037576586
MDEPNSESSPAAASERRPGRNFRSKAAVLAMLCGFGLTGVLFAGVSHLEQDRLELTFKQQVHGRVSALREGLANAITGLEAINLLFASRTDVSREEFRKFAVPLLEQRPYVLSASFIRFIRDEERAAFEAELAAVRPGAILREMHDGHPEPAGRRPLYRAIEYIEPLDDNAGALGLDTLYPARDEAARERAYATGLPSAGKLVPLAQRARSRMGVVIAMPVYRAGAPLTDAAARRAAVIGETTLAVLPGEMIEKIVEKSGMGAPQQADLKVYASIEPSPDSLVYQSPQRAPTAGLALPSWLYPVRVQPVEVPIEVAGKTWMLEASPDRAVMAGEHLASLFTLVLGIVTTLLGTAYVSSLASRNRVIQGRVEERTAQLKRVNEALRLRERAIESSTSSIVVSEAREGNPTVYVNPAFEHTTGYSLADMQGKSPSLLYGADLDQHGVAEIRNAIREQRDGHAVLRCYRKDGTMFWNDVTLSPVRDDEGRVTHFVSIQHDITAMKAYESELHHQATHDALTGLPNRVLLQDRLLQTIQHASRKGHELWLVSMDLDRFKFTNSRLGHKGGDRLLQVVAARLRAAVRPLDTVARLGGDEFALLLLAEQGSNAPRADQLQRVLDKLAEPLVLDGVELFMSCSAGIAVYPADSDDPHILAERADIAMYRAKEMGGSNYQFYTAAMNERLGERLRIESALRTALERREFELHYQPQVDTASGRIVGMEALIRWRHPEMGMVAPNRFIPLAEETGLILPVGAWVLRTACQQLRAWQSEGREHLRMAVNVSARQMAEPDFVQSVAAVLAETGLKPQCLELELTESTVMNDVEHAITVMRQLKKLGVKLAIDDFGTGYSSLAHLKRFEIDVLKIDQTFVRDLTEDPDDAAIVITIIALASNLDLEVISEGVETEEQISFLRQHGCQQMQGYYFSRPVPPSAFITVLEENEARVAA